MRQLSICFCLLLFLLTAEGQGSSYTLKMGYGASFQKWDAIRRGPLMAPSVAIEVEDFAAQNTSAVYGVLGYYRRGSPSGIDRVLQDDGTFRDVNGQFAMYNIGMTLGVRGKKPFQEFKQWFYNVGLRGEYNIGDNFAEYQSGIRNISYFPDKSFIRSFVYGISVGGGVEIQLSEKLDGVIEFNFYPDISKQYEQPAISNVPDPYRPGQFITLRKREIRNISAEITLGIRLVKLR